MLCIFCQNKRIILQHFLLLPRGNSLVHQVPVATTKPNRGSKGRRIPKDVQVTHSKVQKEKLRDKKQPGNKMQSRMVNMAQEWLPCRVRWHAPAVPGAEAEATGLPQV